MIGSIKSFVKEKNMDTLHERLRTVIAAHTHETRRFKELEEKTGISTATWKTYWSRGSRPSAELIEAVVKLWPEYGLWIATGEADEEYGHLSPTSKNAVCNAHTYLQSAMEEKRLARAILHRKYADAELDATTPEREREVVERYLPSAPHLIKDQDDASGEYRAAVVRKNVEKEKRKLEIQQLTAPERALLQALRGYPFVNRELVLASVHALLNEAERERAKIGHDDRQFDKEKLHGN
jgi:hypothetical protein